MQTVLLTQNCPCGIYMGIEKNREYYQGAYYHIYNRGVSKRAVFKDKQDYSKYIFSLREYKVKYNVSLICYCLMPNHIHLVLRQNTEMPIFKFIQGLHTSYSLYFNK